MTPLDWALDYRCARGWCIIPVHGKNPQKPLGKGWKEARLEPEQLSPYFSNGQAWNISAILGPSSGGLVDLDCDARSAGPLARDLAPPTRSIFGRKSKPLSHRLYIVDPPVERTLPFRAPDRSMIIELRGNGQTVLPGSTWCSETDPGHKEAITWVEDGTPARTSWETLERATSRIAAAVLLVPSWRQGLRNDFILALAGTLLRRGWTLMDVCGYITDIMRAAPPLPNQDPGKIAARVRDTAKNLEADHQVTGLPTLRALVDDDPAMDKICDWLHLELLPQEETEHKGIPLPSADVTPASGTGEPAPPEAPAPPEYPEHLVPLRPLISQITSDLEEPLPSGLVGVPTGLLDLDALLGGLRPGDLIAVAGRPGVGKTVLGLGFLLHAVTRARARTLYVSLEMRASELALRLLSAESGIELTKLRDRVLDELDWRQLEPAAGRLALQTGKGKEQPIPQLRYDHFIADISTYTTKQLRADAMRLHSEEPLQLIIVDYLQLLRSTVKGDNRVLQVGQMSRDLKALARDLEVPVVILAQLNRDAEHRSDHRPQLYDLRESGDVEQDCDIVMMLYRESLYNTEMKEEDRPLTELLVRKHRNGPTGVVHLNFLADTTRFVSTATVLDKKMWEEQQEAMDV